MEKDLSSNLQRLPTIFRIIEKLRKNLKSEVGTSTLLFSFNDFCDLSIYGKKREL